VTISGRIILKINVLDNSCRENQNTHFTLCNFPRRSCHLWDQV